MFRYYWRASWRRLTTPTSGTKPPYLALYHSENTGACHRATLITAISRADPPALTRFESRRRARFWLAESPSPPSPSSLDNDPIVGGGAAANDCDQDAEKAERAPPQPLRGACSIPHKRSSRAGTPPTRPVRIRRRWSSLAFAEETACLPHSVSFGGLIDRRDVGRSQRGHHYFTLNYFLSGSCSIPFDLPFLMYTSDLDRSTEKITFNIYIYIYTWYILYFLE